MEDECLYVCKPATSVDIIERREGGRLSGTWTCFWPESVLILYGHSESLHKRACVLAEALLLGNQRIAVMSVFHIALLQIALGTDIMMWTKH
jgi:hypothetical protein